MAPGVVPVPPRLSDEEIYESVREQVETVGSMGIGLSVVVGRPTAVPTALQRESTVMYITQQVNDLFARCVQLFPGRFAAMATLPQVAGVNPRNCISELERCVEELGFIGCKINCDPGEGTGDSPPLGNEWWYPLYEKLEELNVPAMLHGGGHYYAREPELGYFPAEVTVGAWSLLENPRVFVDFPSLKVIVGHGGGYLPYQLGRARRYLSCHRSQNTTVEDFERSLSRLYFDTVLYNCESVEMLLKVVSVDNVLFGTDRPANGDSMDPRTSRPFNDVKWYIEQIPWLTDVDRAKIFEGNLRKLFTKFPPTPLDLKGIGG